MDIRFLSLRASNAPAVVAFYRDILELPCLAHGDSYGVFRAGSTQLMFEQAAHGQPFYHFAFDIPRNQLQPASAWLAQRVDLLERDGETEIFFEDWNATSVYFHDPAGNIVELIARHNLPNDSDRAFSPGDLLSVSEIGWPVEDTSHLKTDFQLPFWRDYGPFKAAGSETGLILLVPIGRGWLPTGRPAEAHPCTVVVADENGSRQFRSSPGE
jgi:catechol 2,3-dioxygenase-like lactoylglutathione lyase family enzyme